MNYVYPIEETWTTEEIINVTNFFSLVEQAYESRVNRKEFLAMYRIFKEIVPARNEEKHYFSAFEKSSNYSSYHVVKHARESQDTFISIRRNYSK